LSVFHRSLVENALRIAGHLDVDATGPTATASLCTTLCSASGVSEFYCGGVEQPQADVLAVGTVQLLRRVAGLNSRALRQSQPSSTAATAASADSGPAGEPLPKLLGGSTTVDPARVKALTAHGVFARVLQATVRHPSSKLYAREAIRLLRDVAVGAAPSGVPMSGRLLCDQLGIDEASMQALQSCVKRLGEDGGDAWVLAEGERLLDVLADVFEGLSGKGFLVALRNALDAVGALSSTDGSGGSVAQLRVLRTLGSLHKVCCSLAPDAMPILPEETVDRVADAMRMHAGDVRVVAIMAQVRMRRPGRRALRLSYCRFPPLVLPAGARARHRQRGERRHNRLR